MIRGCCHVLLQLQSRLLAYRRVAAASMLLVSTTVGWAASGISNAQLQSELHTDLANYLTARSSVEHISTISLAVSFRNPSQDIIDSAGTTRYGGNVAVTPANLFHVGSNTKAFTAAAILQLEAAGDLSIGDTVGKWLPQYPKWAGITIRQILNMTSGIPNYSESPAWQADYSANPMMEPTPEQLVGYVYPNLETSPGAAWAYSNTGYILAQMIVDKASPSKDYATELNGIIHAQGLTNSFYQPYFYPPSVTRRLVAGYFVNTDDPGLSKLLGQNISGFSLGWTQGAGGMIATPEDLTKWVRALFEGNVLPEKQRQELESLVAIPSGQPIQQTSPSQPQAFGLGVFQFTNPDFGTVWGYEGSTIGFRASYLYFPESGLIIAAFTNSQTSAAKNVFVKELFPVLYNTLKSTGRVK